MKFTAALFLLGALFDKASFVESKIRERDLNECGNQTECIEQCVNDAATQDYVDSVNQLEDRRSQGAYYVPFDLGELQRFVFGTQNPINPYPDTLEWTSNVIKAEYKNEVPQADADEFQDFGHRKFPALPLWLLSVFNQDPQTYQSSDVRNTIFLMDKEDRGPRNLRKMAYMNALTCDKLQYYEAKIDAALTNFVTAITTPVAGPVPAPAPVMSAFNEVMVKLYLDIHFGEVEHPPLVVNHVNNIFKAFSQQGKGSRGELVELQKELACTNQYVEAYYEERRQAIVADEDMTTFVYWWGEAGIPAESLNFEAAHNALAFGQFTNLLFLALRAKVSGYLKVVPQVQLPFPSGVPLDFFAKYTAAGSNTRAQLDVVREMYRILIPSPGSLSSTENSAGANDGKSLSDAAYDLTQTVHNNNFIQAVNDDIDANEYNTSRYDDFDIPEDFEIPNGCPFFNMMANINSIFKPSKIDGETVIPEGHEKFLPVFDTPKYCPFGLGYRRCPAEVFNYFMAQKIIQILKDIPIGVPFVPAPLRDAVLFTPPAAYVLIPDVPPETLLFFNSIVRVPAAAVEVPDVFFVLPPP